MERALPCLPQWSAAQALMVRETRVATGTVPRDIGDGPVPEGRWSLRGDRFVLHAPGRLFGYRRGAGITIERTAGSAQDGAGVDALLLAGTVHAAVACLNGLVPVHASAVAHEGRVFAFTGPSGAGKSTLVAALGARGLPMFCDDTLVLDPSRPEAIGCLPGHKRLKLTPAALALTGAVPEEPVAGAPGAKRFARVAAGSIAAPLPLARLVVLERGEPGSKAAIVPLSGAERLRSLSDDHYTRTLAVAALGRDPAGVFAQLAALAGRIAAARFVRECTGPERFDAGVDLVARYVRQAGT